MATEAKSKRDLIWEQKRKAREDRLRGGGDQGGEIFSDQPKIDFSKKSPLFGENEIKDNQNFDREILFKNREKRIEPNFSEANQPASRPTSNLSQGYGGNEAPINNKVNKEDLFRPASNDKHFVPSSNSNQETNFYREQENPRNRKVNMEPEQNPFRQNKNLNFNPSFEPTYDDNPGQITGDSAFDEKKRKNDYGEFLKQQMKQKEMQKQVQKNENKYPDYQQTMQINNERDLEKRRKNEYGEFLRQQMKIQQDVRKSSEMERKGMHVNQADQNFEPFGKAGAGAPLRDNNGNVLANRQELLNQRQDPYHYGNNHMNPYTNGYQAQQYPIEYQQPPVNQPKYFQQQMPEPYVQNLPPQAEFQIGNNQKKQENFNSPNDLGNQQYVTSLNGEERKAVNKTVPLTSDHPQEIARREKMKMDFQRGLQDQIEERKRIKKLEEQKKREEELLEMQKIKKEQEELDRKYAYEKELEQKKNKAYLNDNNPQTSQNENANNENFVTQPKQRKRREKRVQSPPQNDDPLNDNVQQFNGQQMQQPQPVLPMGMASPRNQFPQYQGYPMQNDMPQYYNPNPQQMPPPYFQQPHPYQKQAVDHEINKIRSEIQNQHAILSKQLEDIKKEAHSAMEERNRAEQELIKLREQLKQKMVSEDLYKQNLRQALEKNSQLKIQKINDQLSSNNMPLLGSHPLDAYDFLKPKQQPRVNSIDDPNSREANFTNQIYQIRKTNAKVAAQHEFTPSLEESYMNLNKTLAHETKYIPLTVFDGQHRANPIGHDNLTLSKLHNLAIRPSSSHVWDKHNDTLDIMVKAHQNLRPSSSEQSREYLNTSNLIGKKLDEATALIQQYDGLSTTNIVNKWQNKNINAGDTFSTAGKNIINNQSNRNLDLISKQTFGKDHDTLNYDNTGRNNMMSREKGYSQGEQYDRGYNLERDTYSYKDQLKGMEGIPLGKDALSVLDDTSHISDVKDHSLVLNTTSGSTFNLEKINMVNEARLKKLEAMSHNSDVNTKSKGNYYGGNPKQLETIKEDEDEFAKLDRLLQNYLK